MPIVSIVRCEEYDEEKLTESILKSFEDLGGIQSIIKPNSTVFLKANLVTKKNPQDAATTNPIFIRAIIKILETYGVKVIVGDSPAGPYTNAHLKSVYQICGMEDAIKDTNAALNFNTDIIDIENQDAVYLKKLSIIKIVKDVDYVINLPKLKNHGQMVYTGAIKNMFGVIPGEQKALFHLNMSNYNEFADSLIDIYLAIKPTLNIMDAVIGMDKEGPTAGRPRKIGYILSSQDGFLLDIAALDIVNIPIGDVPIIKNALKRNLVQKDCKIINHGELIKISDFLYQRVDELIDIQFINNKFIKKVLNKLTPRPMFLYKSCIGCGICKNACPAKAISMVNKKPVLKLKDCIKCFCCQELCPKKAVFIKRQKFLKRIVKLIVPITTSNNFINKKIFKK